MLSPVFPVSTCLHISCQMDFINFSQMKYGLLYATALNFSPVIFHCIPLSGLDYCGIIKIYRANFRGLWVFLLMRRNMILWMRQFSVSVGILLKSLKFVFVKDVYSWWRATLEYHEN